MAKITVKPAGAPVPMEGSRNTITGEITVEETAYYRRRILKGELIELPAAQEAPPKLKKLSSVPPAADSNGGAK
jgi:hypothetical protein